MGDQNDQIETNLEGKSTINQDELILAQQRQIEKEVRCWGILKKKFTYIHLDFRKYQFSRRFGTNY